MDVELHAGWPLPDADYAPLVGLLRALPGSGLLVVGHSLGALRAMTRRDEGDVRIVLLAPSLPRPRRGRRALAVALGTAARVPDLDEPLGALLRRCAYARFRAAAPSGAALSARRAAAALVPVPADAPASLAGCLVIASTEDVRSERQRTFARRSGAELCDVPGGHLFPIAAPESTADAIATWLDLHPMETGREIP